MKRLLLAALLGLAGCTNQATVTAIESHRTSQAQQQIAFDNQTRIAKEQLFTNFVQFIRANPTDSDKIIAAAKVTFTARDTIEEGRVQFLYARALSTATVSQYLNDQQGPLNAWFESKSQTLGKAANAADVAKKQAGDLRSIMGLPPAEPLKLNTSQPK